VFSRVKEELVGYVNGHRRNLWQSAVPLNFGKEKNFKNWKYAKQKHQKIKLFQIIIFLF
jgi:hypothetical protein